uniref:Uncharacterized protein n=1 Tax=Oryza rufipogon TaxID=4529 RepID=A0A0E0N868_ORYRU
MRRHGTDMDVFTFASILKAIGSSSSLLEGRQVHTLILKIGYDSVVDVQNSLISMGIQWRFHFNGSTQFGFLEFTNVGMCSTWPWKGGS